MPALAITIIAAGALLMMFACGYALLRHPRKFTVPENDTIAFVLEGPADGQLIRLEGRVTAPSALTSPSGHQVALYELYAEDANGAARPTKRRGVRFLVSDGRLTVGLNPGYELAAFDLPTAGVEADGDAAGPLIERRLDVGARVQVVGRVRRLGAPGHEEFTLLPPEGATGVALTWLAPPRSAGSATVFVDADGDIDIDNAAA